MNSQSVDKAYERLLETIHQYKDKKGSVIPLLQATQEIYGYLPREAMKEISVQLKIPFSEIFGVATFYAQFRFKPSGKYVIKVCSGTACHVRGGGTIAEHIEEQLGIKRGETTDDLLYTLEEVACLGACGLAPVMMVNEETYGRLTKEETKKILKKLI